MFGFRSRKAKPDPDPSEVQGMSGFGFGPYQVVYDKRSVPDPGIPSVAFLTEALPIEQRSGPSFENARQVQTVRHPGEMMIALQGVGLTVIGSPGIPAGYFALQPLFNNSSAPGDIPIIANAPIGSFVLPD